MRCPDCNKFVSLELQDPEVSDLEVTVDEVDKTAKTATFIITGTVRIVRTCGECGQELKEATLDIEQWVELGEDVNLTVTDELLDAIQENAPDVEDTDVSAIEEGGGRYQKSYFGADVRLKLSRNDVPLAEVSWSDKVAASSMDELV